MSDHEGARVLAVQQWLKDVVQGLTQWPHLEETTQLEGRKRGVSLLIFLFSLFHLPLPLSPSPFLSPSFSLLTSATMNRNAVTEATRLVKSGSRAMPGRNTKKANKWNHFLIHMEDGLYIAKHQCFYTCL